MPQGCPADSAATSASPSPAGPFRALLPVLLASGSPRRREFLHSLGLSFEVHGNGAAEPDPRPGEPPADYARRAATAKAASVAASRAGCPGSVVIAADTVVALHGEIMGKPVDRADALRMLARLAGHTHEVVSACCVALPDGARETFHAATRVTMWNAPPAALAAYAATGEPDDKAGAYGIQGVGAFLVESIDGSWSNVVGLPVAELVRLLLRHGVIEPAVQQPTDG
ncbi:Maf family nucleotide pyrophosphatase [Nitratidesulfovibrio sp. 1201_IL3209]|uniref:Maf family nucleotide pyrophosphatase n=1 Tax=Nitratidesulfovibrio sp. 1201_IL3209 TaxID=3084053 RepID=UPI002FDA0C22